MKKAYWNSPFFFQAAAVLVSILLTLLKFWAWVLTNSNAILTDALENIINVIAGCFGLFSLWLSAQPKDKNHPYGHGKIAFISTGFEGGLIFVAGILIIGKASYNLFYPTEIQELNTGLLLVAFSGLINFIMGRVLLLKGRRNNILVLESEGQHLLSDAYSSLGLVIGLFLVLLTDIIWIDHLLAILFGSIILFTGFKLLRKAIAGIMDEADYSLIKTLVNTLEEKRSDNWIDVHNFRVIKYGDQYHIDCHLTLPWYFNVKESLEEVTYFQQLLQEKHKTVEECFIHQDPCAPPHDCSLCSKADCLVRQAPFQSHLPWNLDSVMEDKHHT